MKSSLHSLILFLLFLLNYSVSCQLRRLNSILILAAWDPRHIASGQTHRKHRFLDFCFLIHCCRDVFAAQLRSNELFSFTRLYGITSRVTTTWTLTDTITSKLINYYFILWRYGCSCKKWNTILIENRKRVHWYQTCRFVSTACLRLLAFRYKLPIAICKHKALWKRKSLLLC
jgi:hypothetical protein